MMELDIMNTYYTGNRNEIYSEYIPTCLVATIPPYLANTSILHVNDVTVM